MAGIEHPFGQTVGAPCDVKGQMAVLQATLAALESISEPGGVVYLPFEWIDDSTAAKHHMSPPPIVKHLLRHPLQVRNFIKRDVPEKYKV